MDERILELVKKGQEKIAERLAADERVRQVEQERRQKCKDKAREIVAMAYPEAVWPYVVLADTMDQSSYDDLDSPFNWRVEAYLRVPGLAPISLLVIKENGEWKASDERDTYWVPQAKDDYSVDVEWWWSWRYPVKTDDLELALAAALKAEEQRQDLIKARDKWLASSEQEEHEPIYLPADDSGPTLMGELVQLIRDVVREEIRAAGLGE